MKIVFAPSGAPVRAIRPLMMAQGAETGKGSAMQEPTILTENCYFWKPKGSADQRRRSEAYHKFDVAEWFKHIGMEVTEAGDCVTGTLGDVRAEFLYRESCSNVYKALDVTRGGKKSTIRTLRKLADAKVTA